MRTLSTLVLLFGMASLVHADEAIPLFNGKDLTGLQVVLADKNADPASIVQVRDGSIIITGKKPGYFGTERSYSQYTLVYEWKFPRPENLAKDADFKGNSGCLVHMQPPAQVWPKSVEIQGMNRDAGNTFGVGVKFAGKLNKTARDQALKPVGEWNRVEVICSTTLDPQGKKQGKIITKLNGVEVCTGVGDLFEGAIGWQSEGAEIHYRNITLTPVK